MTSNPNTALQLRHLWAASHLLATTSPAVSAHLATRLLSISSEKGINLPDSVERGVCSACGTVAVWGLNSHVSTMNKRKGKCKAKTIVFECHMCGRSRASAIPPARKKRSARKSKLKAAATISAVPVAAAKAEAKAELSVAQSSKPQAQSLANASSRKRAKSRKGNSLSEILKAKKKQQASSGGVGGGFGLDLMDLMKMG